MAIDPEVLSSLMKKEHRGRRYFPKWTIYCAGGGGVLLFVVLIKTLLPAIGMAFLLAYIWSQSQQTPR